MKLRKIFKTNNTFFAKIDKIYKIFLVIFFCSFLLVSSSNLALAALGGLKETGGGAGYAIADATAETLSAKIGTYIGIVLSFVGVLLLIYLIYGGYLWMADMGSGENVKKAQKIITNAIIGIVIVLVAYAITAFMGTVIK